MPRDDFDEVFTVTDPDGIVTATVTMNKNSKVKHLACAFTHTFSSKSPDGEEVAVRSYWLQKRHLRALLALIPAVIERIETEEDKLWNSARRAVAR